LVVVQDVDTSALFKADGMMKRQGEIDWHTFRKEYQKLYPDKTSEEVRITHGVHNDPCIHPVSATFVAPTIPPPP
jgi:hypothetical protein